jgi:hypothetical protein
MRFGAFALFSLLALSPVRADDREVDHNFHGWYMYFGDHPLGNSKWGVHLEGQWRRHDVITKWQQLLLRPGINYQLNPTVMLTAGYGFIRSYPYGDFPAARTSTEHRIWQQAWLRYRTGNLAWSTRLRFENRFLGSVDETGKEFYRYENRFRGWQQIRVPIRGRTYFTAYDEVWFYVKPYVSNSAFDQNRAYAALGFNIDKDWRFEAGYMNQAVLQRSGRVLESNHTLMFSIFSTAPFD